MFCKSHEILYQIVGNYISYKYHMVLYSNQSEYATHSLSLPCINLSLINDITSFTQFSQYSIDYSHLPYR